MVLSTVIGSVLIYTKLRHIKKAVMDSIQHSKAGMLMLQENFNFLLTYLPKGSIIKLPIGRVEALKIKTKEKILLCTLELAAENGLGNVSLSMIAEKVGIRKATLFSHYKSKDDIIQSLYDYLRGQAQNKSMTSFDYDKFVQGKNAEQVLMEVVNNYRKMNAQTNIANFYKFIYSERAFNPSAALIMLTETETMLQQTRNLLAAMKRNGILSFQGKDMDTASTIFCLTIHELLDMENDRKLISIDSREEIHGFITGFCSLYA